MVSHALGIQALTQVLNRDPGDLQGFHQVLFWDDDVPDSRPVLLYLCLCKDEIHFVQPKKVEDRLKITLDDDDSDSEEEEEVFDELPPNSYSEIEEVLVHAQEEDHFGLVLTDGRPTMHLSSVYRKSAIAQLAVMYNTFMTAKESALIHLRVTFTGTDSTDPTKAFRHPAVTMFESMPAHMDKRKIFFRCGYLFSMPSGSQDRYELMDNRPISTYVLPTHDSHGLNIGLDVSSKKHMVARFLPEAPVPGTRNLSELKFHLWTETIAHAAALREYEKVQMDSFDDYVPQSADIAQFKPRGIAGPASDLVPGAEDMQTAPDYVDNYFVADQGVYLKKMNVVGDQASWSCYRVHIFTRHREIGVIGMRRKFLPPLLDTHQDMVFVMYGPRAPGNLVVDPGFMRDLESIVDSLSPASAASQMRRKKLTGRSLDRRIDRTYYDTHVLQARANALFFSKELYHWVRSRPGLHIIPSTKFIDKKCDELARIFCNSIVRLMDEDLLDKVGVDEPDVLDPLVQEEMEREAQRLEEDDEDAGNDKPKNRPVYVDNPLSIIFRMQSEQYAGNRGGGGRDGDSTDAMEDWRRRIANYFAYCVDGGQLPRFLTIRKLALSVKLNIDVNDEEEDMSAAQQQAMLTNANTAVIDKVFEFLLYMTEGGKDAYEPADNIVHKIVRCQGSDRKELRPGFKLNEWVMVRLLRTQYLEEVVKRETIEQQRRQMKDTGMEIFTYLLKAMLTHTDNLELIEAVTNKIETSRKLPKTPELVDPLVQMMRSGNDYLKTYAIRALTAINLTGQEDAVVAHRDNPVAFIIAIIRDSKSSELLRVAVRFMKTAFTNIAAHMRVNPIMADRSMGIKTRFLQILLDFLEPRFQSDLRHHPRILGDAAMVMLRVARASDKERTTLLREGVVDKLMSIIEHFPDYSFILPELTGSLTLILTLNQLSKNPHPVAWANAQGHCITLVRCLRMVSKSDDLIVANNILTSLDVFIHAKVPSKRDVDQEPVYETHPSMEILKALVETPEFSFERILDAVEKKAGEIEHSEKTMDQKTAAIALTLYAKFKDLVLKGKVGNWEHIEVQNVPAGGGRQGVERDF